MAGIAFAQLVNQSAGIGKQQSATPGQVQAATPGFDQSKANANNNAMLQTPGQGANEVLNAGKPAKEQGHYGRQWPIKHRKSDQSGFGEMPNTGNSSLVGPPTVNGIP